MTEPNLTDPANYLDLAAVIAGTDSFTDWEGIANPGALTAVLNGALEQRAPVPGHVETLTQHWLYENLDQAGYTPTVEETVAFIDAATYITGSRWWKKTGSI